VSDLLGSGNSGQTLPNVQFCKHCSAIAAPLRLVDTRNGKSYRLLRCVSWEKMSWTEEH
jgi:hypothetical protein